MGLTKKDWSATIDIKLNSVQTIDEKQNILKNLLISGEVSKNVHHGKQDKHREGTNNYNRQISVGKRPSILTENAEKLINKHAGKGKIILDEKGNWTKRERFKNDKEIGTYINLQKNINVKTNRGIIHYSKVGAHIIPSRKDRGEDK